MVGNLLLIQYIGIPLGTDPAPIWANLYLYDNKADFIFNLNKTDKPRAIKFKNASRFIDDECNLNGNSNNSKIAIIKQK